jgi:outer membrane receptor protein involved in Fe transport
MARRVASCLLVMLLPFVILIAGSVGKITGTVVEKESGAPLQGVNIILEGTMFGAPTDQQGYYSIQGILPGEYNVRATYIGYKEMIVKNVRVHADLTTEVNFQLERTTIEGEVIVVTAERKLFEKSATSSISITTVDELENIPLRGTLNILSTMAGIVIQDNEVHIRGARDDEVGYYINGAIAVNPLTNQNAIAPIQEAIEEIQVLAGGYTADLGGANAGVVKTELRTGGSRLSGSIDLRADGFTDPEDGKKFLDTYTYGHQLGVATLSGPIISPKARFFAAYEYNNQEDPELRFSEGFKFENLIDKNPSNLEHDTVSLIYPDGYTPGRHDNRYSFNGTLTLDLPVRINLAGLYTHRKFDLVNAPMLSTLNERSHYYERNTVLLTAKATKNFSSTTYLDVKGSYYFYTNEFGDSWFDHDWTQYYDSAAVYDYTDGEVVYRNSWRPQYNYVLNGFPIERNGSPYNLYQIDKHQYVGFSADLTSQLGKYHQIKTGINWHSYIIRHFDISPSVMLYTAPNGTFSYETYGSMEAVPADIWMLNGLVNAYGYDLYGNEISESKTYKDEATGKSLGYVDGPRKPTDFSAYLMDKIEYNDLIINAGVRLDYFDSDDYTLKNPGNPEVDRDAMMLAKDAWKKVDPFVILSPRIGLSFPVTDKTVFYLQYGKFAQMPSLDNIYFSTFTYARQIVRQGYYFLAPIGYGLEPEKTTSYEIGLRQQITENAAFDVTAFYKNVKGLVQIIYQEPEPTAVIPGEYARYVNGDFATTKGMEFRLNLRRVNRLASQINYTLTQAEGTQSNSNSSYGALYFNAQMPTTINPLDYSPTHTGSINLDYRYGKNEGGPILSQFGVNVLFRFSSGHPYTFVKVNVGGQSDPYTAGIDYMLDTRDRIAAEPIGSSTTPWTYYTDLRLDKSFDISRFRGTVYILVNNLFNRKNVVNVYEKTGSAEDDGFLSDPIYSATTIAANGGQQYIDMYTAINLKNAQAYWDNINKEIYGEPRQIFFGVKFEF